MRWVEKYEKEGEIKRENRKPVAYKVHKEHVKFLLDEIKKNKTITMTELKHKLKDKFNIELSRFHINRIVNDNNIKTILILILEIYKTKNCFTISKISANFKLLLGSIIIFFLKKDILNEKTKKVLSYVPSAIFPAIIFPPIFLDATGSIDIDSNPKILAAIIAIIIGYFSRSIIATILVGLASYWFLIFVYYQ